MLNIVIGFNVFFHANFKSTTSFLMSKIFFVVKLPEHNSVKHEQNKTI